MKTHELAMLLIIISAVLGFGFNHLINEYNFSKSHVVIQECTLISHDYKPSTYEHRFAPIIDSKGNSAIALYSTGEAENALTVWDCGKYGRLTCTNKKIYQYAKPKSMLHIRHSSYDTRIIGIEIEREHGRNY